MAHLRATIKTMIVTLASHRLLPARFAQYLINRLGLLHA